MVIYSKDKEAERVTSSPSTARQFPRVHEIMRDYFGKESRTDVHPDEAVALGAAVQQV